MREKSGMGMDTRWENDCAVVSPFYLFREAQSVKMRNLANSEKLLKYPAHPSLTIYEWFRGLSSALGKRETPRPQNN